MSTLARRIPVQESVSFAMQLGVSFHTVENMRTSGQQSSIELNIRILNHWLENVPQGNDKRIEQLVNALQGIEQNNIADVVQRAYDDGCREIDLKDFA